MKQLTALLLLLLTAISSLAQNKLVEYEYWFNNDFGNKQVQTFTPASSHYLNTDFDVTALPNGVNVLNIRYKDENGKLSSILSKVFVKKQHSVVSNKITEYRYWINNDFSNAVYVQPTANQQIDLLDNFDLTQLPKGNHEINYQFKDSLGAWSVIQVSNFEKISFPIANYSFLPQTTTCDSTIVHFNNLSVDGDIYSWDFGDGSTDSVVNPSHTFYAPGNYLVSLTITDTLTLADSTYQTIVSITGNTSHSFAITSCESYNAPDGQVYTTSGIKTAIIPNAAGCDSTITINLTINQVDVNVSQNETTLTANLSGATYQWLDCNNGYAEITGANNQVFTATQNGSYAVEVSQNGCADTSACYAVTTIGILENNFGSEITVYPNPTDKKFTVHLGKIFSNITVQISNSTGQVIRALYFNQEDRIPLELTEAVGVYFITVSTEQNIARLRVIKK